LISKIPSVPDFSSQCATKQQISIFYHFSFVQGRKCHEGVKEILKLKAIINCKQTFEKIETLNGIAETNQV